MIITKKKLLNSLFVLWFASELFFQHQLIAQISMLIFCVAIIACVHKISFNTLLASMFLFICWSIINIVTKHTIDAVASWDMTYTLIVNFVFFILFIQYYRFVDDIKVILTLFCSVVFVFCVVCTIFGVNSIITDGRMYIEGINVNTAAYYAVYSSLWIFYLIIFDKKLNFVNNVSLVVLCSFVIMTGSRGAFLSMVVGVYLLFVIHNKRFMAIKIIVVTLISILLIALIMNIDILYATIGYRIEPIFDYILHGSYEEASLESRIGYSQLAFSKIKESLFWGHGVNCFQRLNGAHGTYSHNNYAEILFSLGVTGFVVYYFPYITNLKYYVASLLKKNNVSVVICVFIMIYLMAEPFRVTYYNRAFLIIPIMSYCFMAKEKKKTR